MKTSRFSTPMLALILGIALETLLWVAVYLSKFATIDGAINKSCSSAFMDIHWPAFELSHIICACINNVGETRAFIIMVVFALLESWLVLGIVIWLFRRYCRRPIP